jgi:hypothetical protein
VAVETTYPAEELRAAAMSLPDLRGLVDALARLGCELPD